MLGNFPSRVVTVLEDLLFLFVQHQSILEILRLEVTSLAVQLAHAHDFIADVLEEGIEVLLEVGMLIADDVAPFHKHVVEGDVGVVEDGLPVVRHSVVKVF